MRPRRPQNNPNTPYLLVTLMAATALAWFLFTQDVFGNGSPQASAVPASADGAATTASPVGSGPAAPLLPVTTEEPVTVTGEPVDLPPLQGLAIETLSDDLNQPVFATTAPGDDRIFVIERQGIIRIFDPETGTLATDPFLDIRAKTRANTGIELGLLGLAFHPGFAENDRFFVYYTDGSDDTAVAEYARADANSADPASERVFISVARQGVRHNAGMLQFGPDGYLYIAIGDGGLFEVHGQDPGQFLGTILRLDVDGAEPYEVPDDNPFIAGGGAAEVWAYGLRNPWRFAIDSASSSMYIGDVGQADVEEIDAVPLEPVGYNFGWPVMEGSSCWSPKSDCDMSGKVLPVIEYGHDEGCSVTGGFVYRGRHLPELDGHYFYADWCTGWIRSLRLAEGSVSDTVDWSDQLGAAGQVTSFGLDAAGELLFTTFEGSLARIVPVR